MHAQGAADRIFLYALPLTTPITQSGSKGVHFPLLFSSVRTPFCCHTEQTGQPATRKCTYGTTKQSSIWSEKEFTHLLSTQRSFPSGLLLTRGKWTWIVEESTHYQLCGIMKFYNVTRKNEVFVNEVSASVVLLSASEINDITTTVKIFSQHPSGGPATRKDGYWPVYILQAGKMTQIKVVVDVNAQHGQQLTKLQALRLDLNFVSYGPAGRCLERQNVILPVQYPEVPQNPVWQPMGNGVVLPVRTHILCHMDDPLEVVGRYAMPHIRMGDMIVIGETPLAIMQGRFRHPCNIIPSLMAKLACKLFHPTSSLATACGMQALLDISGRLRAMFAIAVAVLGRIVGVRGLFYRLAGEQARLIDDVSGTLPPYDQFITLGPVEAQNIAKSLEQKTGCGVAIVDANNLGRVHILAASSKVEPDFLKRILTSNPAGNDDEQTPLVIVRPLKAARST